MTAAVEFAGFILGYFFNSFFHLFLLFSDLCCLRRRLKMAPWAAYICIEPALSSTIFPLSLLLHPRCGLLRLSEQKKSLRLLSLRSPSAVNIQSINWFLLTFFFFSFLPQFLVRRGLHSISQMSHVYFLALNTLKWNLISVSDLVVPPLLSGRFLLVRTRTQVRWGFVDQERVGQLFSC